MTRGGIFCCEMFVYLLSTDLVGWQERTALIMISITVNVIIYSYYPPAPRDPQPLGISLYRLLWAVFIFILRRQEHHYVSFILHTYFNPQPPLPPPHLPLPFHSLHPLYIETILSIFHIKPIRYELSF